MGCGSATAKEPASGNAGNQSQSQPPARVAIQGGSPPPKQDQPAAKDSAPAASTGGDVAPEEPKRLFYNKATGNYEEEKTGPAREGVIIAK
jgi:hypothetical protein